MLTAIVMIALFAYGKMYDSRFKFSATYQAFDSIFWIAFPLLIATGFGAVRSNYQKQLGSLGNFSLLAGIVTALVGFTGLLTNLVLHIGDLSWPLKLFNFFSASTTMMFFGIDALRGQYLPRKGSIPFIAGAVPVLGIAGQLIMQEQPWGPTLFDPIVDYGPLAFVLGTFIIGYILQGEDKAVKEEF